MSAATTTDHRAGMIGRLSTAAASRVPLIIIDHDGIERVRGHVIAVGVSAIEMRDLYGRRVRVDLDGVGDLLRLDERRFAPKRSSR